MKAKQKIAVEKNDLLAAWSILEEMTISFRKIGSAFGQPPNGTVDDHARDGLRHALYEYVTPERVQALNRARMILRKYFPVDELEFLSIHQIPYWPQGIRREKARLPGRASPKRKPAKIG